MASRRLAGEPAPRGGARRRRQDGEAHFTRLSKRRPQLTFVVTYGDPNYPEFGSYLISKGRCRWFVVPEADFQALLKKHRYIADVSERLEAEHEVRCAMAGFEAMDLAEAHWKSGSANTRNGR